MQNIWTMDLPIKERVAQCTMKSLKERVGWLCILQTGVHFSTRVCKRDVCHNSCIKPLFVKKEPYKARHQRRISIDTTWAFGYIITCDSSAANMCCHLCFVLRIVITAGKIEACVPHRKHLYRWTWTCSCQCSDMVLIKGPQSVVMFNVALYRTEPVFSLDWYLVTIIPQSNSLA